MKTLSEARELWLASEDFDRAAVITVRLSSGLGAWHECYVLAPSSNERESDCEDRICKGSTGRSDRNIAEAGGRHEVWRLGSVHPAEDRREPA